MKLDLTIDSGNVGISHRWQVAAALRRLADLIDEGRTEGPVQEINGNTVGHWTLTAEEDGE